MPRGKIVHAVGIAVVPKPPRFNRMRLGVFIQVMAKELVETSVFIIAQRRRCSGNEHNQTQNTGEHECSGHFFL